MKTACRCAVARNTCHLDINKPIVESNCVGWRPCPVRCMNTDRFSHVAPDIQSVEFANHFAHILSSFLVEREQICLQSYFMLMMRKYTTCFQPKLYFIVYFFTTKKKETFIETCSNCNWKRCDDINVSVWRWRWMRETIDEFPKCHHKITNPQFNLITKWNSTI